MGAWLVYHRLDRILTVRDGPHRYDRHRRDGVTPHPYTGETTECPFVQSNSADTPIHKYTDDSGVQTFTTDFGHTPQVEMFSSKLIMAVTGG